MHINMKYYVVSIGAIFIALGIGILVGFNLNYDQELSEQQAQIIKDLETQFESLKEYNDILESDLKNSESEYNKVIEFINKNSELLINNQLEGKNIGTISFSNQENKNQGIKKILETSGTNVLIDVLINESKINEEGVKLISEELSLDIKDTKELVNKISDIIFKEGNIDNIKKLEELGFITISNMEDNYLDVEYLVINSDNDNKASKEVFDSIEGIFIKNISQSEVNIIAVKDSEEKSTDIDMYVENGVTTIDNLNENIGKVSLVECIKNNVKGNFGRLESSQSIIAYK